MVVKIEFDKEFERKFRELAMKKYGFSKGAIKKAGEEAIQMWIQIEGSELPQINNSIEVIHGMMKHVKKTSVELQHEAPDLWIKKDDIHRR